MRVWRREVMAASRVWREERDARIAVKVVDSEIFGEVDGAGRCDVVRLPFGRPVGGIGCGEAWVWWLCAIDDGGS
jgi:hypothetical protein